MSNQERDIARFLSELHDKLDRAAQAEAELQRRLADLSVREPGLAREWEQRERAKIREVEQRCDAAIAEFEAQARETIDQISGGLGAEESRGTGAAARFEDPPRVSGAGSNHGAGRYTVQPNRCCPLSRGCESG